MTRRIRIRRSDLSQSSLLDKFLSLSRRIEFSSPAVFTARAILGGLTQSSLLPATEGGGGEGRLPLDPTPTGRHNGSPARKVLGCCAPAHLRTSPASTHNKDHQVDATTTVHSPQSSARRQGEQHEGISTRVLKCAPFPMKTNHLISIFHSLGYRRVLYEYDKIFFNVQFWRKERARGIHISRLKYSREGKVRPARNASIWIVYS